jgi:trans-AT polyketide synthase/acyltransferase/oxidoreductase domain-containing protein
VLVGGYVPGPQGLRTGRDAVSSALERLDVPFAVVDGPEGPAVGVGGAATLGSAPPGSVPLRAWVPALTPDKLGDPAFRQAWGVRLAYVAGAMANGIGSVEVVSAMGRAGMLGFFGAAGLPTERIRAAINRLEHELGDLPFGVNLIHSPAEPWQEQQTVDLLLERRVRAVEASAFLGLTPMVVQLRAKGLRAGPDGAVLPATRIAAKVSRPEVAEKFLRPAPAELLQRLVQQGRITEDEARLAARLPMADDLTAEADSGGHTDNRPLVVLLPLLQALRDRICAEHRYPERVRIGAAGGIATPTAAAAAFAMGAAYVLTGTVNQACVESGTSDLVRRQLAEAGMADVTMAPASDMFEAGVEVQVLRRGTMFAMRGAQLYEWYRAYPSVEALPPEVRSRLETQILRQPVEAVWAECERFFAARDPAQLERAKADPKHQLALVFRWYLGKASRWAIEGAEDRRTDTQVWCGPAIGAFNDWTRGTFLERPENRSVVTVAANLMAGAAVVLRARTLRDQGVEPSLPAYGWRPRPLHTSTSARAEAQEQPGV